MSNITKVAYTEFAKAQIVTAETICNDLDTDGITLGGRDTSHNT